MVQTQTTLNKRSYFKGMFTSMIICMMAITPIGFYLSEMTTLSGDGVLVGIPVLAIGAYATYYRMKYRQDSDFAAA